MKAKYIGILLLVFWGNCFGKTLSITNDHAVDITTPESWKINELPTPPNLPVKDIDITGPNQVKIKSTFMLNKQGRLLSLTKKFINKMVYKTSQRYVPQSVEGKISLKHVNNKNIFGAYAQFTDKTYNKNNASPTNYRCITNGIFDIGGVLVTISIFSSDFTSGTYNEALTIIKKLTLLK